MWTWCLSNPSGSAERSRRRLRRLVAGLLLVATPVAAESLRQVVVEFRIEPGSTLDQPRLRAPAVTAAAEEAAARVAGEKFLFLEWIPSAQAAAPGAPRWVLLLSDGPSGACDPPSVRARFQAKRGDVVAWSSKELEFSALCDPAAPEMTTTELVAKVSELATGVTEGTDDMKALEERFLSEIVLSKELAPDLQARRLYLPIKGLKAKADSEIEVRFENRIDSRLIAHPGGVEAGRTQLLVDRFACAGIDSGGPTLLPLAWHPRLQELLDNCHEPWVYMRLYKPNPSEGEVKGGVVTTFE